MNAILRNALEASISIGIVGLFALLAAMNQLAAIADVVRP